MTPATDEDLRMLLGFFPFILLTLALESRFSASGRIARWFENWFFGVTLILAGSGILMVIFGLAMADQTPASFYVLVWWLALGSAFGVMFTLAGAYVHRRDAEH